MFKKESKKELQEKGKNLDIKKYKSMHKEEIIERLIENEKLLKNTEDKLSESEKTTREKENLSREYLKHLERMQADFENYKKRQEKKQREFTEFANAELLNNLLNVVDNLERALSSIENDKNVQAIIDGINNTLKEFHNILNKEGVKPIQSIGHIFDPYQHEAVMTVESDKYQEDTVVEEFKKGYYIKSKILRPAVVKVAVATSKK